MDEIKKKKNHILTCITELKKHVFPRFANPGVVGL